MTEAWQPTYSPWRHGGWYVDNIRYPSGAVGCVSRNYPDRKWRIACDQRPDAHELHTYPNRDAAARAEREIALEQQAHAHAFTTDAARPDHCHICGNREHYSGHLYR